MFMSIQAQEYCLEFQRRRGGREGKNAKEQAKKKPTKEAGILSPCLFPDSFLSSASLFAAPLFLKE